MYQKLTLILLIFLFSFSCSKEKPVSIPYDENKAMEIYLEAVEAMNNGDYFFASKKFSEAENILPAVEQSAKAALMSSYCLYIINFHEEASENLERYISRYPADKNISYAYYLLAISSYERILDEKKDITPLLETKKKINEFLIKYPDTEYALDLKFKMDLINNQLAAKELYIAKYYIKTQKWIPAINRLKNIVNDYSETIFIEEALHRLVEVYYTLGLKEEAKSTAILLGYNYNSSRWYEESYKILNKEYKIQKIEDNKTDKGLIKRTIKKLLKK